MGPVVGLRQNPDRNTTKRPKNIFIRMVKSGIRHFWGLSGVLERPCKQGNLLSELAISVLRDAISLAGIAHQHNPYVASRAT